MQICQNKKQKNKKKHDFVKYVSMHDVLATHVDSLDTIVEQKLMTKYLVCRITWPTFSGEKKTFQNFPVL